MFDIKIGTLIGAKNSIDTIPVLNPKGFESYELTFGLNEVNEMNFEEFGKKLREVRGESVIGALGYYRNPIASEEDRAEVISVIDSDD